mgnify:CR=1 FL=1
MFSPDRGYGFVSKDGEEVFFYVDSFERLVPGGPPPLLGEPVIVEGIEPSTKGAPKASVVRRIRPPAPLTGAIRNFDVRGGWGFLLGDDGVEYFLHRSDIHSGKMPIKGGRVQFYPCSKKGKPRACHVILQG